jgi:HSP20 family protein
MAIKDLIPWKKESKEFLMNQPISNDPYSSINNFMAGYMDDLWNSPFGSDKFLYPQIDLSETDIEFSIVTDLPGMKAKDIEILAHANVLTNRGKKETVKEEKNRQYYKTERVSGSFCREIPLSQEVDESKVEATIKNGVLTIHLPKINNGSSNRKRIPIKTS